MGIAGAAAGAGEGLDTYLNRILAQQEVAERARHDQATEALTGRGLDQQDEVRQSLAELRQAQITGLGEKKADAERRDTNRAAMLADPNVPDAVKIGLRTYDALPEGDKTFPWQVIQPKEATPKSLQHFQADVDLEGPSGQPQSIKNGMVVFNPADGSVTLNGTKLDPKRVHGIQSPAAEAAGLQFIQGPEGWYLGNKKTGSASPVKDAAAGGGQLGPATTSATRTMEEGAKMLAPHIASIQKQADELEKNGLFGPAMSRIRHAAEKVGTIDEFYDALAADPAIQMDESVGRFATSLGLLATGAGRVHGGARGGSSPQMFGHFKRMLSDTGTLAMFKGRLGAVNDFMQGYAAGPHAAGSEPTDPSDPMGLGLKKPKV